MESYGDLQVVGCCNIVTSVRADRSAEAAPTLTPGTTSITVPLLPAALAFVLNLDMTTHTNLYARVLGISIIVRRPVTKTIIFGQHPEIEYQFFYNYRGMYIDNVIQDFRKKLKESDLLYHDFLELLRTQQRSPCLFPTAQQEFDDRLAEQDQR